MGWFGRLGVTQGHQQDNHSIERTYDCLFDFIRNYASILYRFRVIASFSSKVTDFNPPHLQFEFLCDLWHQKTTVPGPSCGIICVILCIAILTQYQSVTDRQTDTHTHDDDGVYRASIASRGNNYWQSNLKISYKQKSKVFNC